MPGKLGRKVKSARGTSQDGVLIGVYSDMRIEEKGTSFHESQTSG